MAFETTGEKCGLRMSADTATMRLEVDKKSAQTVTHSAQARLVKEWHQMVVISVAQSRIGRRAHGGKYSSRADVVVHSANDGDNSPYMDAEWSMV